MALPVVLRRIVRQEMEESIAWYENQRTGLGMEFAAEIEEFVGKFADHPEQFRRVRGEIRRVVLLHFPFAIHFLIESDRIVVLAVFHVKRNPKRLEDR